MLSAPESFTRNLNAISSMALPSWIMPAVTASALVFALVHVPLYGIAVLPVDLGAGLLFSWQRAATGRWSVPAATHAAANLLAVIIR